MSEYKVRVSVKTGDEWDETGEIGPFPDEDAAVAWADYQRRESIDTQYLVMENVLIPPY